MSRILLIGYNPPPLLVHSKVEAAHYRTWQFIEPLLQDGHSVCLCAEEFAGIDVPLSEWRVDFPGELDYHQIPFLEEPLWVRRLQRVHDHYQPDCVLAVNFDRCLCATRLRTTQPTWMDFYGDYLTVVQAACYRAATDRGIASAIVMVRQVLARGDAFSVCGNPQQHALVGELAMVGRLNSRTFGHEFAHVVLPAAPPGMGSSRRKSRWTQLSTTSVPAGAFVVLWCGGYNTWTDVDTLFAGLEWAMAHSPRIHFVSLGRNTYQAADNVYNRFEHLISQSLYQDRFHLLGWRPWEEVSDFYRESDVGLNIDALHYETIYGTRTRLVEMIGSGLPVITSLGSELSYLLEAHGAALSFRVGDWRRLGESIIMLASDENQRTALTRTATAYARSALSFQATTAKLRAWVQNPQPAPDRMVQGLAERLNRAEFQARAIAGQLIWRALGLRT